MGGLRAALARYWNDPVLAILVAMVVVIPLVRSHPSRVLPLQRTAAMQLMGVVLFCAVAAQYEIRPGAGRRLLGFLFRGVNGLPLAYFAWSVISAMWVAPAGVGRAFAVNDLLLLGTGVLIYLVIVNRMESRRYIETLVDAVLTILAITVLYRLLFQPVLMGPRAQALLGSQLLESGVLCLLLPVVSAVAAAPVRTRRRVLARGVLALTVVTLVLTPTRSSWTGALAGMAVFGVLGARHLRRGVKHPVAPRRRVAFVVLALGGMLALLTGSPGARRAVARARTLPAVARGTDATFDERLVRWARTVVAIEQRPIFGLGLGNYVLRQHSFTSYGRPASVVARLGATMNEQAHNEYLHVAAELGVPGLILYLWMLLAFFVRSIRALGRLPAGSSKALLIGCTGAMTAQTVDAISNPAWRFPLCTLYFWLVLGIGAALAQGADRAPERQAARPAAEVALLPGAPELDQRAGAVAQSRRTSGRRFPGRCERR